jgi:hypothetical protein
VTLSVATIPEARITIREEEEATGGSIAKDITALHIATV